MKSLKKTLVLLVVFSMILSAVMPAFAAAADVAGLDCEEEVARLQALGVVTGIDEEGNFGPEQTITRAQMAVILCKMVGIDNVTVDENANVPSKFSDVAAGEWYTGHINVAAGKGLLSGFPDGTFRPSEQLTMNQVLTLCVNALGRGEYVAEMGTWPANYIAEATKLGLLDGVKTSDANRGNVAIIAWNTLEAPYVWDVTNTEFEGTINLGNSTRSLLGIYFRDFVHTEEDGNYVKDTLKEAKELTVEDIPATNKDIEDRQIVLVDNGEEDGWNEFVKAFSKKSKDDTYLDEDNARVIATVPEEVWANLDELLGKEVTVLFGEDEVVALIMVTNDGVVENEFVEEYNKDDKEITIAGETYEFAKNARVYVNTVEQTTHCEKTHETCDCDLVEAYEAMEDIVKNVLAEEYEKEFKKKVGASIILDSDDEIVRLDLSVSGTFDQFGCVEAIVTDVDEEEFEYVYLLEANGEAETRTYDYAKLKEDELPKVVIDGEEASLEDIQVGNVVLITYKTSSYSAEDFIAKAAGKIIVTTGLVEGEVTKTKEAGNILYIDGTEYPSTNAASLAITNDDIEDIVGGKKAGTDVEKSDDVTLYVNAYGEIVMVATDKAGSGSDWEFAYVRSIKEVEENDDEEFYAILRLLLPDGTKTVAYSVVVDSSDWDGNLSDFERTINALEAHVIAYRANANKEISLESEEKMAEDLVSVIDYQSATPALNANYSDLDVADDFDAVKLGSTEKVDDDYQEIAGKYDYKSNTVIFDIDEEKVYTRWNALVAKDDTLVNDAFVICEKDETDVKYIFFENTEEASTDSVYALFKDVDSDEAKLNDGEEKVFEHDIEKAFAKVEKNSFVEYSTNSKNEIDAVKMLIDVDAFEDLTKNEAVTSKIIADGEETFLAVDLTNNATVKSTVVVGNQNSFKDKNGTAMFLNIDPTKAMDVYVIENIIPAAAEKDDVITIIQTNEALKYDNSPNVDWAAAGATPGVKKNVYTVGTNIGLAEELDILLYEDNVATIEVYLGNAVTDAENATLAAKYVITPDVEKAATAADVEEAVVTVGAINTNFKVTEVDGYKLTYSDKVDNNFGTLKIDKEEVKVYDVREGEFKVVEYSEENLKNNYVVPFKTAECDKGADANILVIVK